MKYIKFAALSMLVSLAGGLAVSCSDSDDIIEEAPIPAGKTMNVYFNADNEFEYYVEPGATSIDLTLGREKTDAAADVPIDVVIASDGFDIPSTVHFDAGQEEAVLKIGLGNLPLFELQKLSLKVNNDYADHYKMNDEGCALFTANVIQTKWIKVAKINYNNKPYDITATTGYFVGESWILWLKGTTQFRMENFLGSGVDLGFTYSAASATNTASWTGNIIPLDHCYYRNSSSWYLLDDDGYTFAFTTSSGAIADGTLDSKYFYVYGAMTGGSYFWLKLPGTTNYYDGYCYTYYPSQYTYFHVMDDYPINTEGYEE